MALLRRFRLFNVTAQQQALLAILLLRGAQTLNELLTRTERLAKFAAPEDARHQLERLVERELVVRLPKAPGQREERWMHLLSGPVDVEALASAAAERAPREASGLEARVEALEARIAALEARCSAS